VSRRDVVVRESERPDAARVQLGVALAVALEGRARAVVPPAVKLDDDVAAGPVGVDLDAVQLRVHDRAREAVAIAQGEEGRLQIAAGERLLLARQLPDPLGPRSTGAYGKQ